jgi:hypothetical protein
MSTTERPVTGSEFRGNTREIHDTYVDLRSRETRLFARTSEFWAMLVGVAAIVVIYNVADNAAFDLWRACLLGTVLAVAYIVSRGIAKFGSPHRDTVRDPSYRR